MSIGNRPVTLEQIYSETPQTLGKFQQSPFFVGLLKQYLRKEKMGSYDGGGAGNDDVLLLFPTALKTGAEVEAASVKIYADTKVRGLVEIEEKHNAAVQWSVNEQGINFNPDSVVEFTLIDDGGGYATLKKVGSDYILEDTYANFVASNIFGHATAGDILLISGFSDSIEILEVQSETKLKVKLVSGDDLFTGFGVRATRVYSKLVYDIKRSTKIGPDSNGLLEKADIYISLTAVRTDKNGQIIEVTSVTEINELGQKDVDNQVAYFAHILYSEKPSKFYYATVSSHTVANHLAIAELARTVDLYDICLGTDDESIVDLWHGHQVTYNDPEKEKERVLYFSREIADYATRIADGTGILSVDGTSFYVEDDVEDFIAKGVKTGDIVDITSETDTAQVVKGEYTVANVVNENKLLLFGKVRNIILDDIKVSMDEGTAILKLPSATDLSAVTASCFVEILSGDNKGIFAVASANDTADTVTLTGASFDPNTDIGVVVYKDATQIGETDSNTLKYKARSANFTAQTKAEYIAALGKSYKERNSRFVMFDLWQYPSFELDADGVDVTVQRDVPGYWGAVSVVALKNALEVQASKSGRHLRTATTVYGATQTFTDEQLTLIQEGGVLVCYPDELTGVPIVMQQLTTDVSTLEKQEISLVDSVNMFAKMVRVSLKEFMIGKRLTPTVVKAARVLLNSLVHKTITEETEHGPMFGGGTKLVYAKVSSECPDKLEYKFHIEHDYPFNRGKGQAYIGFVDVT